jgi:hypothetical protein
MKVVRGLINPDGDNDYFRVELAQNGTYSFRVDCTLDSVLTLYNASGTLIAENDDDEIGNNNRGNRDTSFTNADSGITISLNAGVYYVRVRSIATAGTLARFRYTLRIFDGSTARDFDPYEVAARTTPSARRPTSATWRTTSRSFPTAFCATARPTSITTESKSAQAT